MSDIISFPPKVMPITKPIPVPFHRPIEFDASCVLALLPGGGSNNRWIDEAGKGNHVAVTGAVLTSKGQHGPCYNFDGTDDYMEVQNDSSLNPSNITVCIWVKSDTATWNDNGFLVSKRDAYILYPNSGNTTLTFNIYVSGVLKGVNSAASNIITNWNFFVGTYDGTTLKFYTNGVLNNSSTPGGAMDTTDTGILNIGKDDGLSRFFDGLIDSVLIFNKALDAEEIANPYEQGI